MAFVTIVDTRAQQAEWMRRRDVTRAYPRLVALNVRISFARVVGYLDNVFARWRAPAHSPQPARRKSAAQPRHALPALIVYGSPMLDTQAYGQKHPNSALAAFEADIKRVVRTLRVTATLPAGASALGDSNIGEQRACAPDLAHRTEPLEDRERRRELLLGMLTIVADDDLGQQETRPGLLPLRAERREPVGGPAEELGGARGVAGRGGGPSLEPVGVERQRDLLADLRLLARRGHHACSFVPVALRRDDLAPHLEREPGAPGVRDERAGGQSLVEQAAVGQREGERVSVNRGVPFATAPEG